MKRSKERRSPDPQVGLTSLGNVPKPASPSPRVNVTVNRQPSLSLSIGSLQSASTATPRSYVQRRSSRPKWLDADIDGGLLKRKTEPATASVTIKSADSIGLARMRRADSESFASNGDPSGAWRKPRIRKAVTLDTVSSPRQTPVPSPRRRVSQSPRSPAFDRIAQEESDQAMENTNMDVPKLEEEIVKEGRLPEDTTDRLTDGSGGWSEGYSLALES